MEMFNSIVKQIGLICPIVVSIVSTLFSIFVFVIPKITKKKKNSGIVVNDEKANRTRKSQIVLFILFVFIALICIGVAIYQTQLVQVIDVTGRSYAEACSALKDLYLNVDESASPVDPTEKVISQFPSKGIYVLKWTSVLLATKEEPDNPNTADSNNTDQLINISYQNNGGSICKQGENYFLATDSAIYVTNKHFNDFKVVTYEDNPINLNSVGDYIYYSTENGIYRIRSDGSEKSILFYTDCRTLKMKIANGCLYYIKATDSKLYYGPNSGGKSEILYNSEISNFCIIGLDIYVCDAIIERSPNNNYPIRTQFQSITCISFNGENKTTIYPYNNIAEMVVDGNLCAHNGILYFSTMEGVYAYPNQGTYKKLFNIDATDSLCVFDDYVYCSPRNSEVKSIVQYQISDGKLINTYYIPLSFETTFHFIFPTEEKIILSTDLVTWYTIDKESKEFSIINLN